MKIVVAMDSLKGSLSSIRAGEAVKKGILNVCNADVVIKPLADGGEGTVEALVEGMRGVYQSVKVHGPLLEERVCQYSYIEESHTVVIEMANAAGLPLVPKHLRNPMITTTYGVGEVIYHAIKRGGRNFIIGIGGSATCDAGIGMLSALGYEFLDKNYKLVSYRGKALSQIEYIKSDHVLPEVKDCTFKIACDVTNPLYGENGAAYIYGPQKGASIEDVKILNDGLIHFSEIVTKTFGSKNEMVYGAGAAGGLGYAFLSFLNATLEPGIEIILELTGLEKELEHADYVITGEGQLDDQTAMGKAPIGIAKLAKKYGAKVIALAGSVSDKAGKCNEYGIDAYFSIVNSPISLEEAMDIENAEKNLILTTEQIFRLIKAVDKK
ncbi:glycerate kinase [Anaeromicropila herbilytica]|uniref:Glycerate kinase n=1 Tax=Anaeromicropila herbilytica TaxID=2785025 RepID=A0A7R7EKQ0_9FIRM|nr:glycerate kinase [Anaeromicropila herbilytica]BCN30227.1 glycerate kinase [Anaeromicropila herbilytica]